ncbi:Ankyrin repeat - like 5 [Theobroma cacao]|nr:Ankyrin repeat - like 5 [Theobroma cacao]
MTWFESRGKIKGATLLHYADELGDIDLLAMFLVACPECIKDVTVGGKTAVHIAAENNNIEALEVLTPPGQVDFAVEMMNWKPSFASTINPDGFTPLHLALQRGQTQLLYELLKINNDLVRVKGEKGATLLHYADELGDIDLLALFLVACPECIKDVTVGGKTAVHIAAENNNIEALEERVRNAAKEGDVEALYELIREKADFLKDIDQMEFVDTPLHVAAAAGRTGFCIGVDGLKAITCYEAEPRRVEPHAPCVAE